MWGLLCLASALAFEVQENEQGYPLVWTTMPIAWRFAEDTTPAELSDVEGAIQAAFDAWEDVPGVAIRFRREDGRATPETEPDLVHVVYFEVDWTWSSDTLAYATTWADPDGTIQGFDLRINASEQVLWSTDGDPDAFDLQSTVCHEVGHALGLAHSTDVAATMYESNVPGDTTRRKLHVDDEDGARFLYPDTEDSPEHRVLRSLLGCSGTGTVPSWTLAIVASVLVSRRRRLTPTPPQHSPSPRSPRAGRGACTSVRPSARSAAPGQR